MRRIAALACGLNCLVLPATASAAVNVNRDAAGVTASAIVDGSTVAGAAFTLYPNADPALGSSTAVANSPYTDFPLSGQTFAVLSSGDARTADPSTGGPTNLNPGQTAIRGNAYDVTTLRIDLRVPPNANCLTLGFRFFTDEAPGAPYNDGFIAEMDSSTWTVSTVDNSISAPGNFAFDQNGDPLSVNSPGQTSFSTTEAAGTGYQYGTQRLSAARSVTPGTSRSLYLSVFDVGDEIVDTAAFLDRVSFLATEPGGCTPGLSADETPPAVTIGASQSAAQDNTPTLSGSAGDSAGDSATVNVRILAGGTPVQSLAATRSGTSWTVDAAPLAVGSYTAIADQTDVAGNLGTSALTTFSVAAPQQDVGGQEEQSPEPVQGRTVVAGAVGSGTVRVKVRGGKFRKLGAGEAIPLGAEIDATKGRVRLTAAAGGGKTQTADFYQGVFIVTQTKGAKPITQLKLSGALSCSKKGKASAAAKKKKVRRLWGDGKGRFRTRGRNAAATVRGTKWLTEDRCDRTRISVRRGRVSVRDFIKKKTKIIKAGGSYTSRDRVRGRRPK